MLELGFYQVLPTCDAAGRAVVAMSPEFHKFVSKELAMVPIVSA